MKYIYSITNKTSGKKYIGQTSDPNRRKEQHFTNSSSNSLRKDIENLGSNNFEFEILDECDDSIKTNFLEINYIEEAATKDIYNVSAGGQLINKNDSYICDDCDAIRECVEITMIGNSPGIILFRVSKYPSKNIEEILFLCSKCHGHTIESKIVCRDTERFPYSKHLTANALMDLVICYDLTEEMINKLIIVDGKMNQRMAYGFFIKRLGLGV